MTRPALKFRKSFRQILKLSLLAALLAFPAAMRAQDTSTPEERAHWVEVLHSLQAHPTDQANIAAAEAVFKRLIEVKDFHMTICPVITELPKKYSSLQPITQLFTLGLAAYQVETGNTDNPGANLYALHSVLKGYAAILAADPKAKNKQLDQLATLDAEGKLPDLIAKKDCK